MTIIDYFNQFWKEDEIKHFTPSETKLYFFLLNVWNNAGRCDWFECKTSTIESSLEFNKMTITRCRESLQKKGLIVYQNGNRKIKKPYYFLADVTNNVTNNVTNSKEKVSPTPPLKEIYLESLERKEITPKGVTKKSENRFSPPTLEELKNYISEKAYNVDAERFFNFYQSKGWYVGKNKMKDWKAAVRTWVIKDKPKGFETGITLNNNSTDKYSESWNS